MNAKAGESTMESLKQDVLMFFNNHANALPLYEAFETRLYRMLPKTTVKVQKTQITFSNRHVYACVSFLRAKKKAELPASYIVITLGLPYPLESERVAAKTEPYPGRWTTHIVVSRQDEVDDELFSWVRQAYEYSEEK